MIEVAIRDELTQIRILLERVVWAIEAGPPDAPTGFGSSRPSPHRSGPGFLRTELEQAS